jgi:hypothetical protein
MPTGAKSLTGAEARGDRVRARGGDPDGVAVGRRLGDGIGADIAARSDAVLDHDLLADARAELLRDDARDDVRAAAGGERHDEADRPVRPSGIAGLGHGGARNRRRRQRDRHEPDHPRTFLALAPPRCSSAAILARHASVVRDTRSRARAVAPGQHGAATTGALTLFGKLRSLRAQKKRPNDTGEAP